MKFDLVDFLSGVFLFKSVDSESLGKITEELSPEIKEFSHKENIYSPNDYEKKVGFIVSGECVVEQLKYEDKAVPLNVLFPGDSFGIMAVLSDEPEFPTRVRALKDSRVVFITREKLLAVLEKSPTVSMNLICFLTEKITFL